MKVCYMFNANPQMMITCVFSVCIHDCCAKNTVMVDGLIFGNKCHHSGCSGGQTTTVREV